MKLLVANRGEIALRIIRAASELAIPTVAVCSLDDKNSLHIRVADEVATLGGKGVASYLDMEAMISAAKELNCTAIHPGYGFLAENSGFARRCREENIRFIGPSPDHLDLFGDKTKAREMALSCGIPLLPGTPGAADLGEALTFFSTLKKGSEVMVKALLGGGGRGMRRVKNTAELEEVFSLCQSEANAAFGSEKVYVERFIKNARHIEVQVIGDGSGNVSHLWERECTLQRRNQKVIEIAPSPTLSPDLRDELTNAAVLLAREAKYQSLGTFEFLVDEDVEGDDPGFFFLEVNPRLQVEHTVTEEVTGIDLVKMQIRLAGSNSLQELKLEQRDINPPSGYAVQCRINMEVLDRNGTIRPSGGKLHHFDPPSGPGVRVDTFAYPGYEINQNFDSLLAKLIVHSRSSRYTDVLARAYRALCEFRIEGVETNIPVLQNLLVHPDIMENRVTTGFIEKNVKTLADPDHTPHKKMYFNEIAEPDTSNEPFQKEDDPKVAAPANTEPVKCHLQGTLVDLEVTGESRVHKGQPVAVVESMKMHHLIKAGVSGLVKKIVAAPGDTLYEGQPILFIEKMDLKAVKADDADEWDPDEIRPDLLEVMERHRAGLDEARPGAVARRRKTGQQTARENIAALFDRDSFNEYGALAVAAQRSRLSKEDLVLKSAADGVITGMGSVNGDMFDASRARCAVIAYDYTVMAGTQGVFNHQKKDRLLQLVREWRIPLVLFAEGGGGRPGDVDAHKMMVAGLDVTSFLEYAKLSGLVPLVGIVSGRCFAGNAALLGCSDVIIATRNAKIGMGGPAMIEGGGLGKYEPDDIGPVEIQSPNGVIDILVEDEIEAVDVAKKYLSYFQGALPDWECRDQRLLRQCIPENRLLAYDIRKVIQTLADRDSVLELRKEFGVGIITALIRIEGQTFGLTANNSMHLGGAIDADAADKAARFIQLCDAYDIPLLTLSDTPGFMVGPKAEEAAQVRHFGRMFVTAAGAQIPIFSVVLRKGYGLGAQAMVGGSYHRPVFNISWPTGEFGGMGLEGAVHLGFKKELEALKDPDERQTLFDTIVKGMYDHGKATNMASFLEIDGVIDPKETRSWVMRGFRSMPPLPPRTRKKRPNIDTW